MKLSIKINQRPSSDPSTDQVHQGPQALVPPVMSTFSLGPGLSTSVLDFDDADAVKLYNKAKHERSMQQFQLVTHDYHPSC